MSLLHRKLQDYTTSDKQVVLRLSGNTTISGTIKEIDTKYLCLITDEGSELTIEIDSVRGVEVFDLYTYLLSFQRNEQLVNLHLQDGRTITGFIHEIDSIMVEIKKDGLEYLVGLSDVARVTTSQEPSLPLPVAHYAPKPPVSVPIALSQTRVAPQQEFPFIERVAEATRQQVTTFSWHHNTPFPVEYTCPVSTRIDVRAGKLWGRALNYVRDRSWAKAAQEFEIFSREYSKYGIGFYNAGACYYQTGDLQRALLLYEEVLQVQESKEAYLNAILVGIRLGYWQCTIDLLKRYLLFSRGSDTHAFSAIDVMLRFGMDRDAAALLVIACGLEYPIDPHLGLRYVALLAVQLQNLALQIRDEIERGLTANQITLAQLMQLGETIERETTNKPSLDYLTSQEVEVRWRQEQADRQRALQLKILRDRLSSALESQYTKEAEELCAEILAIDSDDQEAKAQLQRLQNLRTVRTLPVVLPRPITPPVRRYESRFQRARSLFDAGKLAEAEELFLACIEAQDNVDSAIKNLASIYVRTGRTDKGIEILNKYLPQATEQESYLNLLGQLYFKAERYEEAISAYQKVRDMQTNNVKRVNPMMSIAVINLRMGRMEKAIEVLKKIQRIPSGKQQATNFLERIKSQEQSNGSPSNLIPTSDQADIAELISLFSRPVGTGSGSISDFMRLEVQDWDIVGLDRLRIQKRQFSLDDVDYLMGKGQDVRAAKPEQRYPFFISAAKVLSELNEEYDNRFNESLRRFCAAIGDNYVIKNRDVARTYYNEAFKLEPKISSQLHTKFGQIIMTFLYNDTDVFLNPNLPQPAAKLLHDALDTNRQGQFIHDVVRTIIALTRVNPDLVSVLLTVYNYEVPQLLKRLGRALSLCFSDDGVNEPAADKLVELINKGQEQMGQEQTRIESDLRFFLENANNHQKIFDYHQQFLSFSPEFRLIGCDFNRTDTNRLSVMKDTMRQYVEFYNEEVFEQKNASYFYILSQIQNLESDIKDFPTYHGRCYLLPILRAWQTAISNYFEEVARVSQPHLRVTDVVRCSRSGNRVEAHLLISNREGKSAASGVKVRILDSKTNEYEIQREEYNVGRTIRTGEDTTVPVTVLSTSNEPVVTLSYQLIYTSRDGGEVPAEQAAIPLRLEDEGFEGIEPNPYAAWASADAVTDSRMFKGRDALVSELLKAIQIERQKKMIVIYGQKRAGKSSILHHTAQRMQLPALPVTFSFGQISMKFTIENLFYSLARELHKALSRLDRNLAGTAPDRESFEIDAFGEFVEYVEKVLQEFRGDSRFSDLLPVLILDEFTYIYSNIQEGRIDSNFMKAWKSLVERKNFSFLLSGIDEMPEFISTYPNEFGMAELRRVTHLDDQGASDLIESPIWNHQRDTSRLQESAVKRVMQITANSAYYIQIFNNELVRYMNEEPTGYITEADIHRVLGRLIEPGRGSLNLASNFDNLTRYKANLGANQSDDIQLEGQLLRVIAYITRNQDYASRQAIFAHFHESKYNIIDSLIQLLVSREVLISQSGQQQYAIRVELFKHWLNANIPYREGAYEPI